MKKLMAANWKMFKTREEAATTAQALKDAVGILPADREVLIFPPFTAIEATCVGLNCAGGFSVGGQNMYPAQEGAFTGEISTTMLKDLGATWVLTGHSERRSVLGESDQFIALKTVYALEHGLKVVLCIGESLEEREAGKVEDVLSHQLALGLATVPQATSADDLAIAYEPVWAIGTGKVAGPEEISHAHNYIRSQLVEMMGEGEDIRILYGGSVKPNNAKEIISLDNVNGVLVGGASLQADSFSQIILA